MLRQFNRDQMTSAVHLPQKGSLLCEDEFVILREVEIRNTLRIGFQPCAISLVIRQTFKRDQSERDVVGSLMRHPVAEQIASAFRNDGEPAPGIGFEQMALERIELVANENGNGHELLLFEED